MKKWIKKIGMTLALPVIVYGIFLIICFDRFSNLNCVSTIFLQSIVSVITAYAYAFIYMSGLFDFTIGSRIIISGLVGGIASSQFGMAGLLLGSLIASVAVAALTGALNWICKIPSLILTMALTMVFEIEGKNIAGRFSFVSIDYQYAVLGSVPWIVVVLIACGLLFYFIFNFTKFSYHMRAIGSNEAVSKNAGIRVQWIKFLCFVVGSIFAAVAAVLTISQSGSMGAQTNLGSATLLFQPLIAIIIAVVLQPACNMAIGIFVSQFTLNTIFIGLIAAGFPDTFQNIFLGVFLLIVMIITNNVETLKEYLHKRRLAAKVA